MILLNNLNCIQLEKYIQRNIVVAFVVPPNKTKFFKILVEFSNGILLKSQLDQKYQIDQIMTLIENNEINIQLSYPTNKNFNVKLTLENFLVINLNNFHTDNILT